VVKALAPLGGGESLEFRIVLDLFFESSLKPTKWKVVPKSYLKGVGIDGSRKQSSVEPQLLRSKRCVRKKGSSV